MSNSPHIMVLCNNELAIPALQELAFHNALKAIVVPERNKELVNGLRAMFANSSAEVITVTKKNFESIITAALTNKKIEAAWIMTFPWLVPASLLDVPLRGFINFHYGLLPKYRGNNPVLAQMLQFEKQSGITVHIADERIDGGPIVMQQAIPIDDNDTFAIQLKKLSMLGAAMATSLLRIFTYSTVLPSVPQDESKAAYFNKPVAADLMINWSNMNSWQIIRMINACNPWNKGAATILNNQFILFTEAEVVDTLSEEVPGTIVALNETEGLQVACIDKKIIRVNIVYTPEGIFSGKKLSVYGIKTGDRFRCQKN